MASNFFDQFDTSTAKPEGGGNFFDQFDPASAKAASPSGTAADLGKSLKAGVQRLPGMVTGLADLPIALTTGARPFTQAADAIGEATGFTPGKWADETKFSQGYEDSKKAVDAAWKEGGAADIAGAYVKNPGYTLNQVAESLPSMVAGGAASKLLLGAGRVAGVAADAAGRLACVAARGWRAGVVKQQAVKQFAGRDLRLEVDQLVVDDLGEGAHLRVHGLDADALAPLARQRLVVDQQVGAADGGRRHARALQQRDAAHGLVVVLQQVAGPFGPGRHARLDAPRNVGAGGKRVAQREQRDADVGVCRGLGQDGIGAHERGAVGVAQDGEDLVNLHPADGAGFFRDVGEDFVAAPRSEQLGGRRPAPLGHVGHVGRAGKADVTGK